MLESIEPGLTTAQGILGIQGGVIRKKWRQDDAVALSKPGKTDELKGNLRRINLINSQAKQIEAILGDVVEAQSAVDPVDQPAPSGDRSRARDYGQARHRQEANADSSEEISRTMGEHQLENAGGRSLRGRPPWRF